MHPTPTPPLAPLRERDLLATLALLPADVAGVLRDLGPRAVLAGGMVRSVVSGAPVHDIDIFVQATADEARRIAHALAASAPVAETSIAFTVERPTPVQIIFGRPFHDVPDLLAGFDFTVCKAGIWWTPTRSWRSAAPQAFYDDLASLRLTYSGPPRDGIPWFNTLERVVKLARRGYTIDLPTLMRIARDVVEMEDEVRAGRGTLHGGSHYGEAWAPDDEDPAHDEFDPAHHPYRDGDARWAA